MESIGSIAERALQPEAAQQNTVPCCMCGVDVLVQDPERWEIACPSCGNVIKLTRRYRERRGFVTRETGPACQFCQGSGFLLIPKQIDERVVEYGFRCVCPVGKARPETGIPQATGVDLAPLMRMKNKGVLF